MYRCNDCQEEFEVPVCPSCGRDDIVGINLDAEYDDEIDDPGDTVFDDTSLDEETDE